MPFIDINLSYNLEFPLIINSTVDLAKVYNIIIVNLHLLIYKAILMTSI